VIIPEDAGLAVLKGAVQFGFNPKVINPRISRFTYGVKGTLHVLLKHLGFRESTYHNNYVCFGNRCLSEYSTEMLDNLFASFLIEVFGGIRVKS
jgi:hypothetical protein